LPKPRAAATRPRKQPVQARSTQLVADILQAAIRVLEREGAQRFTTIRVAEQAGVSVGSLYQYFPNKQSILFRLQLDEWEQTGAMIEAALTDASRSHAERLRETTRAFFRSEVEEAPLRLALDAALPSYHDAPETRAKRQRSLQLGETFIAGMAPKATPGQRAFASELLFTTLSALGKSVSERAPTPAEVTTWADATSDMLLAYLAKLAPRKTAR